ncbi:LysR family transcriptional regulator [Caballeronia sp. LZ019]|uniref:LysR family transcriptional regulator n=1 Tax=Caballeronia sp. LZ019 TaxID=3038555 RepID=UPI0028577728|nr:LysR family transcriptional regulator [Caballeronia sp. LZ019]MDR5809219.1 LysR family transcriptional regulator [Caballeronia sp. LZ019]
MKTHFTLRQIEYFLSVAETGQISRSASLCAVTQSSMTIALKNLEDAVGVDLLARHPKGVRLTEAGERFLRHAKGGVEFLDRAVTAARAEPNDLAGSVAIGVTDSISAYLMPPLLLNLSQRFARLNVNLVERDRAEIERLVANGELDFGLLLVSNTARLEALEYETLIRSPRRLWTHPEHPLQTKPNVTLDDVAREDYLLLDMDEHLQTVDRYWGQYGLAPRVILQTKSIEAIRSFVALGQGVTILSDFVFRQWSLEGNRISRRNLDALVPSMDIGTVCRLDGETSSQARAVLSFFQSVRREAPAMLPR